MDKLKKFPFFLIVIAYVIYLSFQLVQFEVLPEGEVAQHEQKITQLGAEVGELKKRLAEGQTFIKQLEDKKAEIRSLLGKLSDYQGLLSESLEVPSLIKNLLQEAKKIQIRVESIEPGIKVSKQYYVEQEIKLDVKGNYSQIVLLVQRISQLQRILGVVTYSFKPSNSVNARTSDQLDAKLSVRAYQYADSESVGEPQ
jgi:Tfp pilus assembly protein PilO